MSIVTSNTTIIKGHIYLNYFDKLNQIFIDFYFFYRSDYLIEKQMEKKSEVLVQAISKEKQSIRITKDGIFEVKMQDQTKIMKKMFPGKKLHLRIQKTEIVEKRYRFIMRASEEANYIDFIIENKETLEALFEIAGHYATIVGLQQLLVSFRKVGEGAFAQVYEAITNYQTRFALKSFQKKSFLQADKAQESFRNEIDAMKMVESPYLLPFSYLFQSDKAFYLKMQFFQKTLKERLTSTLSVKKQKQFMRQLMMGLCQLRTKNIIHRDLKPDNIMIRRNEKKEEECVIIDFGLATVADAKEYLFIRCGTPGFLAPEIANLTNKKEKQTCASDMFSLGCIFYKILTGHYLFPGKSAKDVLHNNRKCIYSKNAFQGLSVNQANLLTKMLEPNPNKRIKPEQALKAPYFKDDVDDEDEIPEEECYLNKFLHKMGDPRQIKNMDSVKSSSEYVSQRENNSVTSQAYKRFRHSNNSTLKDSCLTLQLGQNVQDSEDDLLRAKKRSTSKYRSPEKSLRQSRFSRVGRDISNVI